jgi:hypothetical protein
MLGRSYFTNVSFANTGANGLDIARIGMDLALLTGNSTLLADAYGRAHTQVVIENGVSADGIRPDGSFGASPSCYKIYLLSQLVTRPA